jgi:hypothetical protein
MKHDENWVKRLTKKFLDEIGAYHYPAAASPYGVKGIPDIIACYNGRFVGIECKRPGRGGEKDRGCTRLQVITGQKIREAGGVWAVVDGEEDLERLRGELKLPAGQFATTTGAG